MNWFVLAAGVLYVGGAALYFKQGHYALMAVMIAYAAANFALVMVK